VKNSEKGISIEEDLKDLWIETLKKSSFLSSHQFKKHRKGIKKKMRNLNFPEESFW
jgi:hypothetical protein